MYMAISNIVCISHYIVRRVTVCGTRKQEVHAEFFRNFLGNDYLED
jgi:hypothetical protein